MVCPKGVGFFDSVKSIQYPCPFPSSSQPGCWSPLHASQVSLNQVMSVPSIHNLSFALHEFHSTWLSDQVDGTSAPSRALRGALEAYVARRELQR